MRHGNTRGGFTLIELLVTIGIVGILLGLLLPALGKARGSALQTVALSNVRQVGTQFEAYAGEHGAYPQQDPGEIPEGALPAGSDYEPRGDEVIIPWYPGGVIIASTDYFGHSWMWPAMVSSIDDWPTYWETWISPRKDQELPRLEDIGIGTDLRAEDMISITYANGYVTRPSYWNGGQGSVEFALLREVRPHDVRYPSAKVMLWDDDLSYIPARDTPERVDGLLDAKTPMAFGDGHADVLLPADASEGVENIMTGQTIRLHNTKDGVHGRDYE